jgi:hypothetical protein
MSSIHGIHTEDNLNPLAKVTPKLPGAQANRSLPKSSAWFDNLNNFLMYARRAWQSNQPEQAMKYYAQFQSYARGYRMGISGPYIDLINPIKEWVFLLDRGNKTKEADKILAKAISETLTHLQDNEQLDRPPLESHLMTLQKMLQQPSPPPAARLAAELSTLQQALTQNNFIPEAHEITEWGDVLLHRASYLNAFNRAQLESLLKKNRPELYTQLNGLTPLQIAYSGMPYFAVPKKLQTPTQPADENEAVNVTLSLETEAVDEIHAVLKEAEDYIRDDNDDPEKRRRKKTTPPKKLKKPKISL